MATWIALFRGINVGGRNKLPMAELRRELEAAGCSDVRSYIQSGNVVLGSSLRGAQAVSALLADVVEEHHGFRPEVLALKAADLHGALEANPFPEAADEPKTVHLNFLERAPRSPDRQALERLQAPSESWRLIGRVFYLHAPDGIGRSKLAAAAERHLGEVATGRNLRTCLALVDLLETAP